MEIYLHSVPWRAGVEVRMRYFRQGDPNPHVAKPIEFSQVEEGSYTEPAFTIGMQTAQRLMDELWNCGLRPTEGTGSAGSLAATERHLADMRKLAYHALKVKP